MSEGYVKTSANNVNDLLNQIVGQAVVHGWTQLHLGAHGREPADVFPQLGRRGHISKDGVVVNLASFPAFDGQNGGTNTALAFIPERFRNGNYYWGFGNGSNGYVNPDVLALNVSSGFDINSQWFNQPGSDRVSSDGGHEFRSIRAKDAIGNVWMFFFENPASLAVICEVRPGEFYWLTAGNIDKGSDVGTAQFYGASLTSQNLGNGYPTSLDGVQVRCTHAEAAPVRFNGWGGWVPSPVRVYGWNTYSPADGDEVPSYPSWRHNTSNIPNDNLVPEVTMGYDSLTGRMWLHPVRAYINRRGGGRSYLGVIPHVHYCTMSHFVGEEVISIGGVEYMIFPASWRSTPYDWDEGELTYLQWGPWYRNSTQGTGIAVRRPN